MCEQRNEKWFQDVKLRLAVIPNDTAVTADGGYHKDCKRDIFLSFEKNRKNQSEKNYSFINLVVTIRSYRTQIWNVVELYKLHSPENEACSSSWKDSLMLIKRLLDYFDDALVSFV